MLRRVRTLLEGLKAQLPSRRGSSEFSAFQPGGHELIVSLNFVARRRRLMKVCVTMGEEAVVAQLGFRPIHQAARGRPARQAEGFSEHWCIYSPSTTVADWGGVRSRTSRASSRSSRSRRLSLRRSRLEQFCTFSLVIILCACCPTHNRTTPSQVLNLD